MKARVYLSLGALLFFLAPLGCSDKAESPAPENCADEHAGSRNQKSRSSWMRISRWRDLKTENPDCYYTYFRMQNASEENVIFFISTKMSASGDMIRIAPGEQGTWGQTMEKMSWIDDNDVLVKNLDALGFVELYFNVPPAEDINYRLVSYRDDTCAMYSFFEPMTEAQHGTPRDQSAWVLEKSCPTARTLSVGPTGLPTRTIRKPCVRRSNAGQAGTRKKKD